ncbi:hypothetical protein [Pseudonocardia sp. NPDC049635]|uniref:hypothetical protein n=1 Tax=Pseudonocardia sp. NPDC049635 TaxID=3155506 RepID=UPI0033CFE3B7
MDGRLARDGLDPTTTPLRTWCSAAWSAVVDLLSTGAKVEDVQKLWDRAFHSTDGDDVDGEPDRESWGLLPEHVAGQERLMQMMGNAQGGDR